MRSRYFRRRSTGQWLESVVSSRDGFSTPARAHIQNMEDSYNLPGDIELVEVVDGPDPRSGPLLKPTQAPPPVVVDPVEERLNALEQAVTELDQTLTDHDTRLSTLESR